MEVRTNGDGRPVLAIDVSVPVDPGHRMLVLALVDTAGSVRTVEVDCASDDWKQLSAEDFWRRLLRPALSAVRSRRS